MPTEPTVLPDTDQLRVVHLGFAPSFVPYEQAWAEQRRVHEEVVAGGQDTVLLLEHEPVYTAGKRTASWERPTTGAPVVDVDRGGRITWHGPGQLVGYPIVRLPEPFDVIEYVRRVEQVLIERDRRARLATTRVEGRSGVWLLADGDKPDRKVGAIGVRVARGVTMHGFAVNCDPDLGWYSSIVACGIEDASVTSLSVELGRVVTVQELLPLVEARLTQLVQPSATSTTSPRSAATR